MWEVEIFQLFTWKIMGLHTGSSPWQKMRIPMILRILKTLKIHSNSFFVLDSSWQKSSRTVTSAFHDNRFFTTSGSACMMGTTYHRPKTHSQRSLGTPSWLACWTEQAPSPAILQYLSRHAWCLCTQNFHTTKPAAVTEHRFKLIYLLDHQPQLRVSFKGFCDVVKVVIIYKIV